MIAEIKDELALVLLCIAIMAAIWVGTCMKPLDTQLTFEQLELEAE